MSILVKDWFSFFHICGQWRLSEPSLKLLDWRQCQCEVTGVLSPAPQKLSPDILQMPEFEFEGECGEGEWSGCIEAPDN